MRPDETADEYDEELQKKKLEIESDIEQYLKVFTVNLESNFLFTRFHGRQTPNRKIDFPSKYPKMVS